MRFTAKDKLDCARREVKMRRRVYPRWVAQGRMSMAQAEREIAIMGEIADDYAKDEPGLPLEPQS